LATKISFINEIANFAEKVWWNINDIAKGIWTDTRIWEKFLDSGIWYWWSCFPKDVKAFIETWKDYGYNFKIIKATEEVNKKQKILVVNKLIEILDEDSPIIPSSKSNKNKPLKNKIVSIWWLSFKPETDDIRDAPSIDVIKNLLELWIEKIKTYDPIASENIKKEFSWFKWEEKIKYCKSSYDALIESDALIILTEWWEFLEPNIKLIRKNMRWNIIIDWRNIWNKKILKELDFIYKWIWQWN
jgi:UDPglucose 6-dehydrogenase